MWKGGVPDSGKAALPVRPSSLFQFLESRSILKYKTTFSTLSLECLLHNHRRDREDQGGENQCSARPLESKNQRTKALWRGFYVCERAMVITDFFSSCIPKWRKRESYRWILLICPFSDLHEFGSDVSGWDGHYTSHIKNCGTLLGKFKLEDQISGKSTSN